LHFVHPCALIHI
jgi:hypothetical protein